MGYMLYTIYYTSFILGPGPGQWVEDLVRQQQLPALGHQTHFYRNVFITIIIIIVIVIIVIIYIYIYIEREI